ncbi:unnamed protein product [Rhizoctonia solani]|uniref:Nephrocystin 3-like N-terminal domain-containing protein n=1 Tax=Rhizoctonia solani TaxID=456999 RepID=A0A8H3CJ10_9AGAM|nr:unnamed protein product [Rhizoctonia solani]CAE6482834.1 unnamed protein product [Rhizoctonia solani]
MPPPIPKPKRQLSIPFFNLGGKRSRTSSPSRVPSPGTSATVVTHPHNVTPTTATCNSLPGGEPELPALSLPSNHSRDSTNLAAQGTTQGPPVAPIGSASNRNTTEVSWIGLGKALAALHITTKICPPLYSAIEGLRSCLHIFEEAARSRKDYKELAIGLKAMVDLLIKHMSVAASREIKETVESIAKKITEELESIDKRQSRSGPSQMLGVSRDDDDLIRRYRRIEQLFRQLQAEASMSTWDITKRHHVDTQLEKLGPAKLATYNSRISMDIGRRSCTENTRTKILSDSTAWADDPNGAKIYWMNGMAGTGKTTIAYSLCERLEVSGQLAASFFCTRTSRECSEAKQIVPTIAYQLARRSAPFRDALCGILDKDPDIGALNTASQFDSLLAKPLLESAELMARNLVIVVDALDECNDPHAVRIVLDILFRHAADLPVKFFVTSRPEPAIRNSMMAGIAESNRSRSILYLHEIEKSLVQADIELYLKDELNHMLPVHCTNIEELAEQAGNLFIYAATAVRYIQAAGKAFSSKRLATILDVTNRSRKSLSGIDALYSAILTAAIHDNELEPEEQEIIRVVLWTAICAHEPVLVKTLAALSGFDETDLAISALQPLRSVLHVSEHNNFVTTLHASFPDFMFSQERSQEFFCDRSSHDHFLARRCLEVMKAQLRFNICKLESSFNLDDEIPDLKERITTYISQELFYACRFWVDHLNQVPHSELLLEMVYEFLSQRLLFWMEVLNLNKCMVVGAVASTKVNTWLRLSQGSSDLINLAHDAQTFVGNYAAHQVSTSTPHIYLSALPFSSPTSQIRLIYQPRFTGLTQATGSLMDQIDQASLAVWKSDYPIRSASFSADRKYIAIGDDSGRISMRHPHNGECLITFQAHRKVISSISFSSDATLIASGSYDNTVCIWNVSNGLLASGPFKGHRNRVNSVMFSSDKIHLASGSEDRKIRIWTTAGTSKCQLLLTGHTSAVKSVMFSPDGLQIVSGSSDRTVRIWNTLNGAILHNLRGHTAPITCVRFSPCGAFIVSASNDRTIRVWDTHNGTPIGGPFENSDRVTSIAISPGGERIVSGSFDHTVRIWDRHSGMVIAGPFEGHTNSVRSVEFSADGARIVSASDDKTVRVWNSQGKAYSPSADNLHSGPLRINMIAISPDGAYIASRHEDFAIRVWNVRTGKITWWPPGILIYAATASPLLITFSSNNTRIFVACGDGSLYTLDLQTKGVIGNRRRFSPHESVISQPLAVSTDGRSAVSCAEHDLCELGLWDLQSNQLACVIAAHEYNDVFFQAVFSSNSTRLATGTKHGIIDLWDGRSGQHVAGPFRPTGRGLLRSMDISPDGTRLVSISDGETLRFHNIANGTCAILPGLMCTDLDIFVCVRFSPNAANIALLTADAHRNGHIFTFCDGSSVGRGYKERILAGFSSLYIFGFILDEPCIVHADYRRDEITAQTGVDINHQPFSLHHDGWIRDNHLRHLAWIPSEIRNWISEKPNELRFMHEGSIGVFYDQKMKGKEWSKCYIGDQSPEYDLFFSHDY